MADRIVNGVGSRQAILRGVDTCAAVEEGIVPGGGVSLLRAEQAHDEPDHEPGLPTRAIAQRTREDDTSVSNKGRLSGPPGVARQRLTAGELLDSYEKGERSFAGWVFHEGVPMHGARLDDARLERTVLTSADFRGASLRRVNFRCADVEWADFRKADLRGAVFDGALVMGARFEGANLTGASFLGARFYEYRLCEGDIPPQD